MRIRPGRKRSLWAGIVALIVTCVGLAMMAGFGGMQGFRGMPGFGVSRLFILAWVLIGLGGAVASFYNAFSRRGLPLYEIDLEEEDEPEGFCPQCGRPTGEGDSFCRHCGAPLR